MRTVSFSARALRIAALATMAAAALPAMAAITLDPTVFTKKAVTSALVPHSYYTPFTGVNEDICKSEGNLQAPAGGYLGYVPLNASTLTAYYRASDGSAATNVGIVPIASQVAYLNKSCSLIGDWIVDNNSKNPNSMNISTINQTTFPSNASISFQVAKITTWNLGAAGSFKTCHNEIQNYAFQANRATFNICKNSTGTAATPTWDSAGNLICPTDYSVVQCDLTYKNSPAPYNRIVAGSYNSPEQLGNKLLLRHSPADSGYCAYNNTQVLSYGSPLAGVLTLDMTGFSAVTTDVSASVLSCNGALYK